MGEVVVLRYVSRGRVTGALPTRLVSAAEAPVLWLAAGTTVDWPGIGGRRVGEVPLEVKYTAEWSPMRGPWRGDGIVILARPGRAHSIWLFWRDWVFRGWYVQLESPWSRSRFGFDTQDHTLDISVDADGTWHWKDEDELEVAVASGFFNALQAAEFRAEGERVLAEWPFPTGWETWRPDPSWPIPALPDDPALYLSAPG